MAELTGRIDDVERGEVHRSSGTIARRLAVLALLALAGSYAGWTYHRSLAWETTDDAFIAASTYRIAPQVAGRVKAVHVTDNQAVKAGEPILEIDEDEFRIRVEAAAGALDQARAEWEAGQALITAQDAATSTALVRARAEVVTARARLEEARSALEAARAEAGRTAEELRRYLTLDTQSAVSVKDVDAAKAAAAVAESQLREAEGRIRTADAAMEWVRTAVPMAEADRLKVDTLRVQQRGLEAGLAQARTALARAELDLARTHVTAPAEGRVTVKSVQPGDYLAAGTTVMVVVGRDPWVVANYKETQLARITTGQDVTIHVDAYNADLEGTVESIQAGSGAQFSLLPPQNATGNFVKVVQRVPVRIALKGGPEVNSLLLGPGMSVVSSVRVR